MGAVLPTTKASHCALDQVQVSVFISMVIHSLEQGLQGYVCIASCCQDNLSCPLIPTPDALTLGREAGRKLSQAHSWCWAGDLIFQCAQEQSMPLLTASSHPCVPRLRASAQSWLPHPLIVQCGHPDTTPMSHKSAPGTTGRCARSVTFTSARGRAPRRLWIELPWEERREAHGSPPSTWQNAAWGRDTH